MHIYQNRYDETVKIPSFSLNLVMCPLDSNEDLQKKVVFGITENLEIILQPN